MKVLTMAEMAANGEQPEILFWVGCAGSFDQRAQKITKAFATILDKAGIRYAILGKEESCTGDPARRAGNEFMFQMMAYQNLQIQDLLVELTNQNKANYKTLGIQHPVYF